MCLASANRSGGLSTKYLTKPIDAREFLSVIDAQLTEPSNGGAVEQGR